MILEDETRELFEFLWFDVWLKTVFAQPGRMFCLLIFFLRLGTV